MILVVCLNFCLVQSGCQSGYEPSNRITVTVTQFSVVSLATKLRFCTPIRHTEHATVMLNGGRSVTAAWWKQLPVPAVAIQRTNGTQRHGPHTNDRRQRLTVFKPVKSGCALSFVKRALTDLK